jgi:hypothetical protein
LYYQERAKLYRALDTASQYRTQIRLTQFCSLDLKKTSG